MYETLLINKTEGVMVIKFNRPDAFNALNLRMREELCQVFEEIVKDVETKAVVLTGTGKSFCAGGDVKEQGEGFDAISGRDRIINLQRLFKLMVNLDKPIICAVNGVAVGAGFNLALAGDLIIAAEEARFSQIFINLGLIPDFGGMFILPRLIGLARAKDLVFTGRMVDAREAKDIGLVSQVVPLADLETTYMNLAKTLATRSARALAFDKSILNRSQSIDIATLLELESFSQGICFQSEEHKQLLKAFLNRKK
ncbi:MAG: enoyl-CoA hydratase/isomerase family protein [Syntrophomonas sp.]|nr:enoyl-CoA hydratase/isomerase family protein [Syntrophomonas sp.]